MITKIESYGNTGVMYRPSGQTARESTRAACVVLISFRKE